MLTAPSPACVPTTADVVDVYVFRRVRGPDRIELLQLLRARKPMLNSWHPVMGHLHPGEPAIGAARRELKEETGLSSESSHLLRLFALEQTYPFFIPETNQIVMSPRFAAEVSFRWQPILNDEHSAHRWTSPRDLHRFMWPGQLCCIEELLRALNE